MVDKRRALENKILFNEPNSSGLIKEMTLLEFSVHLSNLID